MIIQVEGAGSLAEYRVNPDSFVMDGLKECKRCQGALWRHGKYERKVKSQESELEVWVPRLKCRACRITYSCLFSFMVPFKRYEAAVLDLYVEGYIHEECTYRDAAWTAEDGERADA